jgi:hypothetical protein
MKALTKKTVTPAAKAPKALVKPALKVTRKAEAQCCAKQSRTVAGCHD